MPRPYSRDHRFNSGDRSKSPVDKSISSRNMETTGKLNEAATTRNGVRLKYCEPMEAAKPDKKWRLHVFKKDDQVSVIPLYPQSHLLFGRDPKVPSIVFYHFISL